MVDVTCHLRVTRCVSDAPVIVTYVQFFFLICWCNFSYSNIHCDWWDFLYRPPPTLPRTEAQKIAIQIAQDHLEAWTTTKLAHPTIDFIYIGDKS